MEVCEGPTLSEIGLQKLADLPLVSAVEPCLFASPQTLSSHSNSESLNRQHHVLCGTLRSAAHSFSAPSELFLVWGSPVARLFSQQRWGWRALEQGSSVHRAKAGEMEVPS